MRPARRLWIFCALLTGVILLTLATSSAQTFSVVHDIDCTTDGCSDQQPIPITQGRDGNLYGRMYSGGANGDGTAWKVTPTGTLTDLYDFTSQQSNNPVGGLTLALNGNFYGATPFGGDNNVGFVFKLTPVGAFTNLYSFTTTTDGGLTGEPLTLGPDGNLYGLDWYNCYFYKITVATGVFSNVSNTCPVGTFYALTLGTDGRFYGITNSGGTNSKGSVFYMNTAGKVTTIHSFNGTDGEYPVGQLVQASDGNLYGVTSETPTSSFEGEIYKVTPAGTVTVLHTFAADGSEGANIVSGLLAASDGNLYGTTNTGGSNNDGTLYMISRTGTFKVLRSFTCGTDGCNNWVPLAQRTDGTIYGVSMGGGTNNAGTIYKIASTAFPRFISVQNYSAKSGATVDILGTGFTGATAVNFGTVPATSFKVVNSAYITAVVPPTAITGLVSVATTAGKVSTLKNLKMAPTITGFSPASGPVGTVVTIKGTALTGATKVTFGGIAAKEFTVNSVTQITATVPTGAVTGKIVVTTPGGAGTSATSFTVN
jgi:uncharacterized repeat protein (TIGR03803 family)